MKSILWLPAWYPNQIEPLAGDFIQRHARAASIYDAIQVIHVLRDRRGKVTTDVYEENFSMGNLNEQIIYYYSKPFPIPVLDKIISTLKYKRIYKRALAGFLEITGKPYCSHVHVVSKNGILARWLKEKKDIRFVISEHWTIYLPEAKPNFSQLPFWQKCQWRKTIAGADGISAVSQYLSAAMQSLDRKMRIRIIPNVLDENLFYPLTRTREKEVHFIHISSLSYQKNFDAVLRGFAGALHLYSSIKLSVFGPIDQDVRDLARLLKLDNHVFFYEEVAQPVLAAFLQQTDALISYSRYETFGCVLIEANACGIPVIVADIPVHHELITENENGFFVSPDSIDELSKKIVWFAQNQPKIQKEQIALAARQKYNYETVGKIFDEFYNQILETGVPVNDADDTERE